MWAEKDGVKYFGSADIWLDNCDADYEYYAMAVGNDNNSLNEWYKDNNVREDLTIRVYKSSPETTLEVGCVNYNLAAYINAMLKDADGNAAYIEAAKAIYAYSYVSEYYGLVK